MDIKEINESIGENLADMVIRLPVNPASIRKQAQRLGFKNDTHIFKPIGDLPLMSSDVKDFVDKDNSLKKEWFTLSVEGWKYKHKETKEHFYVLPFITKEGLQVAITHSAKEAEKSYEIWEKESSLEEVLYNLNIDWKPVV